MFHGALRLFMPARLSARGGQSALRDPRVAEQCYKRISDVVHYKPFLFTQTLESELQFAKIGLGISFESLWQFRE